MNWLPRIYDLLVVSLPVIVLWFLSEPLATPIITGLLGILAILFGIKQGKQFISSFYK